MRFFKNIALKYFVYILLILIISITYINCGEKNNGIDLIIPELPKNCLHGQCVSGQWYDEYTKNYFVVILKDNVELKAKPLRNSPVLSKFNHSARVTALYIKPNQEVNNGGKEKWIYIRNLHFKDECGWILKSNLGFKYDFKKLINSDLTKLEFGYGDVYYKIILNVDGSFKGNWLNTYPSAKKRNGTITGLLYKCNDLIALIETESSEPSLFINRKNVK